MGKHVTPHKGIVHVEVMTPSPYDDVTPRQENQAAGRDHARVHGGP